MKHKSSGWERCSQLLEFRQLLGALVVLVLSTSSASAFSFRPTCTPATARTAAPSSVYINLPFCRRRCFYCDFPIKVVGDRPETAAEEAKPYVERVVQEIQETAACLARRSDHRDRSENAGHGYKQGGVRTLFFGGGTPSLCPPELVEKLMETVGECFGIASDAEISMEMDPGTFDEERLERFLALGITRVSMGVQSFDAELLKACGRAHSLEDVYDAVEVLHSKGVENFSIDLMSGLPNQTLTQWEYTLSEAISTGAAHVSVYDLQVEAGTAFGRWYAPGQSPLPQDDTCADMYRMASGVLNSAGYEHYEISNYARAGFQSRHNRAYWENVPFLAFGNGAASYVDGRRFSRPRKLPEYAQWVERLASVGWLEATTAASEALAMDGHVSKDALRRDALFDDVMLGFRLKEGLDLDSLASKYGPGAAQRVEEGVAEGLRHGLVLRDNHTRGEEIRGRRRAVGSGSAAGEGGLDGEVEKSSGATMPNILNTSRRGRIRLSDPDGFLFSNSVISSVFCELDDWERAAEEEERAVAGTG